MSLRINTNIAAFNTHRNLSQTEANISSSLEKLSSGLRINRASDDATGLSIADRLLTQVNGLQQANNNAQDAISLLNTADGALNQIGDILQRMRELAVQSADGTLTTTDRANANAEVQQLMSEIDNITSYTTFNGYQMLNTTVTTFTFQVGANNGQTLATTITGTSSGGLTLTTGGNMSVSTQVAAQNAIKSLDAAITQIDSIRGSVGAVTNRLSDEINNISITQQNESSAQSQIRDTDMASEMSNLTRLQILAQSGTAMLSQANAQPQTVLSLFH